MEHKCRAVTILLAFQIRGEAPDIDKQEIADLRIPWIDLGKGSCLPQNAEPFFAYHVEHIVTLQHGGRDDSENLALACYHCYAHKGPNLSGLDPESGALVRLFHPRQDRWDEHFERNGVLLSVAVRLAERR